MKKYYRKIVFANSNLKVSFRYDDKFQILPVNMGGKPQNQCARHFPLYLEYTIDFPSGEPEDMFELGAIRINKEKEILNLLSCLTNHRFFNYDSSMMGWGIIIPNKLLDDMTDNEKTYFNNQESQLFMGGYIYRGLKEDLEIDKFSDAIGKIVYKEARMHEYYTDNPVDDHQHEVSFPNTISSALYFYYNLSQKIRDKVNSCIYLACDGMDISSQKRSLSFLSYVSAIEGLVGLEIDDDEIQFECENCKSIKSSPYTCPHCGRPIWGIKQKFINFLSKFVAGSEKSQKIYRDIYNLRSKMTHTGKLFLSDYELSFSEKRNKKDGDDWLMRLKTLQLFRISLDCWLRYAGKKKQ